MDQARVYRFDDEGRTIRITRPDLPTPWINYLSNGRLHAFVSQAGGGFAWWKTPITYRLMHYRYQTVPADSPGFYTYIREADGRHWSPTFRPSETPLDSWCAEHGPGVSTFTGERNGIRARLRLFCAWDFDAVIYDLDVANTSGEDRTLDVFAYAELAQLEWMTDLFYGYYIQSQVSTFYDEDLDAIIYRYQHTPQPFVADVPLVYLAANRKMAGYSGDRDAFLGPYRYEKNPLAVEAGRCGNETIECGHPCAAGHLEVKLRSGGSERMVFALGLAPGGLVRHEEAVGMIGEHLMRGIQFTESNLGPKGFPLTFDGDWNDIILRFSRANKGESVFAAQQYVLVLRQLIDMARWTGRDRDRETLEENLARQATAIHERGWDGNWWLRGFTDDGDAVGTAEADYGKIFINPQSWSVIAGLGTEEQNNRGLDHAIKYTGTDFGLRLVYPGFVTYPHDPDPFTGYNPGCGENGAVFCQANGWANVTQVTGTAAWMDIVSTQYLLGIRPTPDGLLIDPCIPEAWSSFDVERTYRGVRYRIRVRNPDHVAKGVCKVTVDGEVIDGARIGPEAVAGPVVTADVVMG